MTGYNSFVDPLIDGIIHIRGLLHKAERDSSQHVLDTCYQGVSDYIVKNEKLIQELLHNVYQVPEPDRKLFDPYPNDDAWKDSHESLAENFLFLAKAWLVNKGTMPDSLDDSANMLLRALRIAKEISPMDHFIRTNDIEGLRNFLQTQRPNEILPYYKNLAKDKDKDHPHLLLLLECYESYGATFSVADCEKLAAIRKHSPKQW